MEFPLVLHKRAEIPQMCKSLLESSPTDLKSLAANHANMVDKFYRCDPHIGKL